MSVVPTRTKKDLIGHRLFTMKDNEVYKDAVSFDILRFNCQICITILKITIKTSLFSNLIQKYLLDRVATLRPAL